MASNNPPNPFSDPESSDEEFVPPRPVVHGDETIGTYQLPFRMEDVKPYGMTLQEFLDALQADEIPVTWTGEPEAHYQRAQRRLWYGRAPPSLAQDAMEHSFGEYDDESRVRLEVYLKKNATNRGFMAGLRRAWVRVHGWVTGGVKSVLVRTIKAFLLGDSDAGGLLAAALENYGRFQSYLKESLDKSVANFVKDMAFDASCLAVHLMTSNTTGKIFSVVEFLWRQLGPHVKISMTEVWRDYISPFFSRRFGKHVRTPKPSSMKASAFDGLMGINVAEGAAGAAAIVGCLAAGKKCVEDREIAKVVTSYGNLGRDVSNCKRGVGTMIEFVAQFIGWVKTAVMWAWPGAKLGLGVEAAFKEANIDISRFILLHAELTNPDKRSFLISEIGTFPKIVEAVRLGNEICHAMVEERVKIPAAVRAEIGSMRREIAKFADHFETYKIAKPNRRCPFHIQFTGPPGCGKSELMINTSLELPKLIDEFNGGNATPEGEEGFTYHENGDPKVWSKGGASKYDDKYSQEMRVMTWDDIFAANGEQPESSDALWLLRAVSSMTCPLNMADTKDKGQELRVLLIVTSSNQLYPRFDEVRMSSAIHRRRNVLVECVLVPGETGAMVQRFNVRDAVNVDGPVLKDRLTYEELLVYMARKAADFLKLPLHGSTRLSAAQRGAILEGMRAAADATPANPHLTARDKAELDEAIEMAVAEQPVYDLEEAREQFYRPGRNDNFPPCACCRGRFCMTRLRWRCQDRDASIYNPDLENALEELDMWYCDRRDVLYLGEGNEAMVVNFTFILEKVGELSKPMETVLRYLYTFAGNGLHGMLEDMSEQMPDFILWQWTRGRDFLNVWNWSVQQRIRNLDGFFPAPLPGWDEIMHAAAGDEDEEPGDPPAFSDDAELLDRGLAEERLRSWHEKAWTAFTWFIYESWKVTQTGAKLVLGAAWDNMKWLLPRVGVLVGLAVGAVAVLIVYVVVVLIACDIAVRAYLAFRDYMGWQEPGMEAAAQQGPSGGDARTARAARVRIHRMRARGIEEAIEHFRGTLEERGFPEVADRMEETLRRKHPEMFAAADYETLSERFLEKSLFEMKFEENGAIRRMQCLGVKGNLALAPWHYVARFGEERRVEMTYRGVTHEVVLNKKDFFQCENEDGMKVSDCAVIRFPATVGQFPDLLSKRHFVPREGHGELDGQVTEIPSWKAGKTYVHTTKVRQEKRVHYVDDYDKTEYIQPVGYTFAGVGAKMYCGAPLVKTGAITQGCIFGMLVAMDAKGRTLAIPLDKEFVEHNIDAAQVKLHAMAFDDTPNWFKGEVLGVPTKDISFMDPTARQLTVYPEGSMEYVATLKEGWAERVCNKTDIVPSPIHGVFPVQTGPSVKTGRDERLRPELRDDSEFTPLNEGAKKYSVPIKPFSARALELATRFLISVLVLVKPLGGVARKLTEVEMINGVQEWGYTRLNMLTSAGWPHKRLKNPYFGTKGKRFLFEIENGEEVDDEKLVYRIRDPQLRKDLDAYQENLNQKKRTFTVTYSNLKDERRSLEKIAAGKTRLFDCMSLPNTLLMRKYFGSWAATMNQHCVDGYSAVGIDPEGPQWSALFRKLSKWDQKVIAGDFQEWDGRLDPEAMMKAVTAINRWYQTWGTGDWTPNDDIIRQILIMDVIRTYTIYGNTVVFKTQGLPSGMAITADFNGIVNAIYMLAAFYTLRPTGCDATPDELVFTFYGDDHVIAVSPRCQAWYNFNSLKKYYADHGIVYTDAMKRGGEVPNFLNLVEEATFLKRRFSPHPVHGRYIRAPIERKTIEELACWIRKTNRPMDALMSNLRDLQRFAYHHGKDYYEKTVDRVNAALTAHRIAVEDEVPWHLLEEDFEEMDRNWTDCFV